MTEPSIILPPPDLCSIIDKTAQFVAKNGPEFEHKIIENERTNMKFSFLNQTDPYRPYYDLKVTEFQQSPAKKVTPKPVPRPMAPAPAASKGTSPPYQFRFFIDVPPGLSAMDAAIMRLSALWTAKHGASWAKSLTEREAKNPQFGFLHPHHALHALYQKLISQYTALLDEHKDTLDKRPSDLYKRLERYSKDPQYILEAALYRSEYLRSLDQEKNTTQEHVMFQSINWQDFTIVETLPFTKDNEPRPPYTLQDLKVLVFVKDHQKPGPVAAEETVGGSDMDLSDHEDVGVSSLSPVADSEEQSIPRAFSNMQKQRTAPDAMQLCPVCQQSISATHMEEHVRLELLDPKWGEQRKRYMEKIKDSNLIDSGIDVGRHLAAFTKRRAEISSKPGEQPAKRAVMDLPAFGSSDALCLAITVAPELIQDGTVKVPVLDLTVEDSPDVMTIHDLKNRIADRVGLANARQKLTLTATGSILKNSQTLTEAGIRHPDRMELILGYKERGGKR